MRLITMLLIAGTLHLVTGCASSESSVLTRNETNSDWSLIKHVKGIPITVKVPTHVKLYVYEKVFLQEVKVVDGVTEIREVELPIPVRDFAQDFIYTEKVIMVDFKRPAAGAFNLEVDLTEDQYLEKIQHDVTDETIQRVTELVGQLAPEGIGDLVAADDPGGLIDPKIKEIKSVVAVGVFEVDAPDFELQIAQFLECHLNKAHDAWVTPPWIEKIHRPTVDRSGVDPILCPLGDCPTTTYGAVQASSVPNGEVVDLSESTDYNNYRSFKKIE